MDNKMSKREQIINGLKELRGSVETMNLLSEAIELLKNEPNAPAEHMSYFRLIAIKNELETENKALKADVKELRRLTGSLTNLCENLLKRIAADDRT